MDQEEWDEIWAEAREMGRIEYRRIGMGETKMVWLNGKMDREEGYELWAEAREMGRIEYRRIGMGEEAGGEVHQCNSCRHILRQCMMAWGSVKSSDLRLDKSLGMRE